MTASAQSDKHRSRVEVPGGQGVQVGDQKIQENTFIRQYVETQIIYTEPAQAAWPVRVGDVLRTPRVSVPRRLAGRARP